MFERIGIVPRKELTDNIRDRRTLVNSLLSSLLGPFMLFLLLLVIGQTVGGQAEQALALPVSGAAWAPGLMAYLKQRNVLVQPAPADPEAAVRAGEEAVVLVVGEGYAERLRAGLLAPVQLVADGSRQSAAPTVERARAPAVAMRLFGREGVLFSRGG